jgi:YVTN family beta-propeller protein
MNTWPAALALAVALALQGCGKKSDPVAPEPTPPPPPSVIAVHPAAGQAAVSRNTLIYLTFSTDMKPAETQNALTISGMTGQKTWWNRILVFRPDSLFNAGDTVRITVTTAAQSASGTALAAPFTSSFICGTAADSLRPTVIYTSPAAGQTGVSTLAGVTAGFSEKLVPWSAAAFSLSWDGVTNVLGNTALQGDSTIFFSPSSTLCYDRTFTALIDTGVYDLCGNRLLSPHSWTFQTIADTVKPKVLSVVPANADTMASVNQTVRVRFSEPMDTASARAAFSITPAVTGNFSWTGDSIMTFSPTGILDFLSQFQVAIGAGARDLAGNPLASTWNSSFTTIRGIYVCCQTADKVDMLQQNDLLYVGFIPCTSPRQIRISADGSMAYILTQNGLEFVQPKSHNSHFATVNLPATCYGLALSPNGTRLAVTDTLNKWLYLIDAVNATKLDSVQTGAAFPKGVSFNQGSSKICVLCWGQVEIYSASNMNNAPATVSVPNNGEEAVRSISGDTLYVSSGTGFTAISISSAAETFRVTGASNHPFGLAVSPDGAHLALACYDENAVKIYRTSASHLATVPVGTRPKGLAYSPDGRYLYVSNSGSGDISVISRNGDIYTPQPSKTVGSGPWGITITP